MAEGNKKSTFSGSLRVNKFIKVSPLHPAKSLYDNIHKRGRK